MAGRGRHDPADFRRLIDEAKGRRNLSDIIGRHVRLKRRGRNEMVGLCPFHEERTPSFEVNDSKGFFHCHGCGVGGDAMDFLRRKDGMTFRQAFEALTGDTFPEVAEEERVRRREEDAQVTEQRIAEARAVWDISVPAAGTLAEVYAWHRGITMPLPPSVRFAMTPRFVDRETGETGPDLPAMLCALQDVDGRIVGIQRIFLARDGKGKLPVRKPKLSLGIVVGSVFRARQSSTAPEAVVICEGPEDGLSLAQELPGRDVWVSCGTAMLSRLKLPVSVQDVTIAGDNNAAGRKAADEARAVFVEQGLTVREVYPAEGFKDWNDELRGVRS